MENATGGARRHDGLRQALRHMEHKLAHEGFAEAALLVGAALMSIMETPAPAGETGISAPLPQNGTSVLNLGENRNPMESPQKG
jgi:hypothetical protein